MSTYPILRYFEYDHLPDHLQGMSKPFGDLAHDLASKLPRVPETSVALRKLLEAKDAAVRAALDDRPDATGLEKLHVVTFGPDGKHKGPRLEGRGWEIRRITGHTDGLMGYFPRVIAWDLPVLIPANAAWGLIGKPGTSVELWGRVVEGPDIVLD